ncbi:MAG: hypothetical protein Q8L48_42695 [Archangium sp.]|nr:hypothetical protein [Archangium sp.]
MPLLLLGAGALIAGLWTGLSRLGAVSAPMDAMAHGPLMVSGFLGTVISLERAVAARAAWAFSAPLLCGAGAVALIVGRPLVGAGLLSAGSAVVVVVLVRVLLSSPLLHHGVLVLAALSWLAGNVLLALGRPVFEVVVLWVVFLVGTIAAERLELTRVLPRSTRAVALFVAALGLMVTGALLTRWQRDLGMRVLAAGELGLAAWLLRFDIARHTVRQHDLVRFIALALLSGYGWLALAGGLGLAFGNPLAGPHYDAILHATFVGFVFSMIFGHAPIIVPAVLGVRVPFHARFYVHLGLLHASLALRLTGDLLGEEALRRAGSWGNTAAIVLFLGSTALAVARAPRAPAQGQPQPAITTG